MKIYIGSAGRLGRLDKVRLFRFAYFLSLFCVHILPAQAQWQSPNQGQDPLSFNREQYQGYQQQYQFYKEKFEDPNFVPDWLSDARKRIKEPPPPPPVHPMQIAVRPTAQMRQSGPRPKGYRNGLPPTRFDSFVLNAGPHAEHIYGDESLTGPPPYECFSEVHRINTGILTDRDTGITTNHGSMMPDAFGRDEFLGSPEWSQSGTRGYETIGPAIKVPVRGPGIKYLPASQQFNSGMQTLDKEGFYDEDRMRPPTDPYHPMPFTSSTTDGGF